MKLSQVPGRNVIHDEVDYLHFSGTSYLGMAQDAFFTEKLKDGLTLYGNNFGSSRNGNLQIDVYELLEKNLSNLLNLPYVLSTSSGTLAARLLKDVMSNNYHWNYASNTHPALLSNNDGTLNFNDWINAIELWDGQNAICFNSVDPLNLETQDFSLLSRLDRMDRVLVVDDSHGIGVLGSKGQGISETLQQHNFENVLIYGSLAKALGVDGGFIATDNAVLFNALRSAPLFAGASPMAPAFAYAFNQSIDAYQIKLKSLRNKLAYFESELIVRSQFKYLTAYPVFRCFIEDIQHKLFQKNILISSFSYPYPEDPAISRIIINDLHTKEDLDNLLNALEEIAP